MMRRRVVGRRVLRTAAVGGVAYAAGSHSASKAAEQQQMDASQNAQIADLQQQQAAGAPPQYAQPQYAQPQYAPPPPPQYAPPPPPPPEAAPAAPVAEAPVRDPIEALKQLGELKTAGIITDEEFEVKKAQLLKQI